MSLEKIKHKLISRIPDIIISHKKVKPECAGLLYPEELQITEQCQMTPLRFAQFAAGRASARGAIVELGLEPVAISSGPCGNPLWPVGAVGSISHKQDVAIAAVARAARHPVLGVDLETEDDRSDARAISGIRGPEDCVPAHFSPTMLLCIKESYFKAQYPHTKECPDWEEINLRYVRNAEFRVQHGEHPDLNAVLVTAGPWIVSVCTAVNTRV